MKRYDPGKLLIGIHIPKCAGSSMKEVMRRFFGRQVHWHYVDAIANRMPRHFRPGPAQRLAHVITGRGYCVYGHFNHARGFGVADYYPDAEQLFTVVRDPLSTVLSRYFAAKRLGERRMRGGKPAPIAACYASFYQYALEHYRDPA